MRLQRGFAPEDREEVARLYWDAFGDKLGAVLGPRQRALDFLGRMLRPDHALCAYSDEVLLGVAGFHTTRGSLAGGSPRDLAAYYGPAGGLWRAACFAALERKVDPRQLVVDGLFVTEAARGRGVGSALIEALAREALSRGYMELRLEVIDTNGRARALYERRGFTAVRVRKLRALRPVFGFSSSTIMVRRLN